MKRQDISKLIADNDTKGLAKIAEELSHIKHTKIDKDESLTPYDTFVVKDYYKESIAYSKKVFEDQSTCDVTDGAEKTIPYQIGLIKAYCQMILKG